MADARHIDWEFYNDAMDISLLIHRLVFSEEEAVQDYAEFKERIIDKFPKVTEVLVGKHMILVWKDGRPFLMLSDQEEQMACMGEKIYEFRHRKFREFIDRMFRRVDKEDLA